MMAVTRRYRFSASHRLHSFDLSPAENEQLYGKCNHKFGHGHDYVLEISASGEPDSVTGLIVPLRQLDGLVNERVLQLFDHRYINMDVPQFASLVPTTENIVLVIADLLREHWDSYLKDSEAHLSRVRIEETGRNGFEILFSVPESPSASCSRAEGVLAAQ
jgi:6-pyruvoyltetrahydropterin/6-carboxytetrahydropterin synthase